MKKPKSNGKVQKDILVGKDGASKDASIEEIQMNTAAAAGLGEETEADSGTAGEKSTSLAASPPSAAPGEDENETDALAALLAAQAAPAEQPAAAQQVEGDQAAAMDGAEDEAAAPVPVRMPQVELIDQRNAAFAADARKHAAEKERVKQQEHEDQLDCDQADWYEKRGDARRTGPGVGYGHFDSDLSDADYPAEGWGRNYRDMDAFGQKRWTAEIGGG